MIEVAEGQTRSVTFFPVRSDLRHEIYPRERPGVNSEPDYFRLQLDDFVSAVQFGSSPKINGEQGSRSVALTERCYEIATPLDEPWCCATLERLQQSMGYEHKGIVALQTGESRNG
jgi:hypothetical protein